MLQSAELTLAVTGTLHSCICCAYCRTNRIRKRVGLSVTKMFTKRKYGLFHLILCILAVEVEILVQATLTASGELGDLGSFAV